MEENVYVTDYPKKLREEAQKRNIEFEESIYEFIDMFLHYHIDSYDGSLYRVEIEVENVTNNIRLILYTEEKHKIEMLIPGGRVTDIEFSSRIARIPKGTADEVARRIQKGSFIHNELLDVETTLQKAKGPWSDLVMKSWFMRADQEGVEACSTYLVYFNEEIYQTLRKMKEIEKGTGFLVQLIKIGGNRVKVIKLARDFTGLDVTDAKDLVLQAPNAVLRAETAEKAVALCEALRESGASVKCL